MTARKLSRTDAFYVEQAKKLLAALEALDWATTTDRDMAGLLGRTEVILAALIETVDGGAR